MTWNPEDYRASYRFLSERLVSTDVASLPRATSVSLGNSAISDGILGVLLGENATTFYTRAGHPTIINLVPEGMRRIPAHGKSR